MDAISYLDFDLLLERAEGGYRARLLSGPAGEGSVTFSLPFSELELENFILRIGRTRHGMRGPETQEVDAVRAFGSRLFEAVISGPLRDGFARSLDIASEQGKGLRLRLRMTDAAELADIPWEYLYDSSAARFLALSIESPIVRYLDLLERIRPLMIAPPLHVLVMMATPPGFPELDVNREWENLRGAFADLAARGLVTVDRLDSPTLSALQSALRRKEYHVFHFVGHGAFARDAQSGVLMLADDMGQSQAVSGPDLGALLRDERTLRLVVLNACEGARTSRADPFAGVAQSLVKQGIPAVIAMQFDITDRASIAFTREFYGALADGYPVDASLAETRKAIFAQGNKVEWGTPVLYMRAPDGRIFDIGSTAQPTLPAAPPAFDSAVALSPVQRAADGAVAPPPRPAGSRMRRWIPGLIALLAVLIAGGLYLVFRPFAPPTPPAVPAATSTATATSAPSKAPAPATPEPQAAGASSTPILLHRSGLMTYIDEREGEKTLYVLGSDGTSAPLIESVADLAVLAVSPDRRYLAVTVSPSGTLSFPPKVVPGFITAGRETPGVSLWVVSVDGRQKNIVIAAARGVDAAYASDGRLVAAAVLAESEGFKTVAYYVARSDGSQLREIYRSENDLRTPTRQPVSTPTPGSVP